MSKINDNTMMVAMVRISGESTKINGLGDDKAIILSTVERARTVTHIASSGSLCTYSFSDDPLLNGAPFGSHVDYVLDASGWPIFLLAEASLHTKNIKANNKVSLLCQTPTADSSQPQAAMSRVTLVGHIEEVIDDDELIQLKATFSLVHSYADQLAQSPRFKFYKLNPSKIYYVGGYGVLSKWLDVGEYQIAKPDILADEAVRIAASINRSKQEDLTLVCKQFAGMKVVDNVVLTTVDRLGLDIRVTSGQLTDEFRIGFRQVVSSVEDAKSEIVKIFQEAWEKEQGFEWEDQGPPVQRYAEDILRG
jgi:putative heme iron utilization protein